MLRNGDFIYWTQGPIASTIILADHTGRKYDMGFDQYRPFRPIFHATFWPALNKIRVRFIGEIWWWIKERARSDKNYAVRMAVVQGLARGWKDDAETLRILKERSRSNENNHVRIAAIQELARGWKDDADVIAILKSLQQT